ncbi:ly6/PLAUR domain-containing protein 5-like isoform X2 [Littorina saxatilis]|uniref:ly6/PLAUR domain-containing protein 5-like isoform X2 n=1 Tax=Littorina saxatilis TaxID=31220 RepID=UPI0038B69536
MVANVIKTILVGFVLLAQHGLTEGQTPAYTGPTNAWTGPTNPWTGPTNPWTGPTNPWTGPTNPWTGPTNPWTGPTNPWTGPTNPWTGPTNPWTGTANAPATTTTPANNGNNEATPAPVANPTTTPSSQEADSCYSFSCEGPYADCYLEMGQNSVCSRSDQYCKVTVQEDKRTNITTTTAECVEQDCELTKISSVTKGDTLSGCCDSHLCNDENLLQLNSSARPVACLLIMLVTAWVVLVDISFLL